MPLSRSAFVAGTAAFASTLPRAVRAADPVVTVGITPADASSLVMFTAEQGFFRDAGLDVEVTTLTSGPVIATAILGGTLDAGAINLGTLVVARSRGVALKVFACAGVGDANDHSPIAVRKDSAIQNAADLDGKIVGIPGAKTLQHASVLSWIDQHGGDSKSVKFLELPMGDLQPALESRRVDAVLYGEPFTTMAHGDFRSLGGQWDAIRKPFLIFGYCATDQWLAAHADTATKLAGALRQGATWANGHQKETAAMFARFAKIDPQVTATMHRAVYGTTLEPSMIQPIVDVMVHYGFMDKPIDPNDVIWQPGKR